jgi:GGDEF domain-containing protein
MLRGMRGMRPAEYIKKLPKTFCILSCTALLAIIGFVDYITGEEISLSVFYLIPDTVDDMLKKADTLMYSAKDSGKNKIMHETVD